MESLLKMDIFFFITSIAVVLCTIVFIIASFYVIKTMKNVSEISDKLRKGVNDADTELREMSEHIRESAIFSFIFGKKKKKREIKK